MSNIVIITGAGISAESGVPIFRGENGMWGNEDVKKYMTKNSLQTNLIETCKFYNERRKQLLSKEPNPAHIAIAKLQNCGKHNVTLITQNIDTLHEKAGSKGVIHMHGNISKLVNLCDEDDIIDCGGDQTDYRYRPWIVFFGESILGMDDVFLPLKRCELFISIGTSDNVHPACEFVNMVPKTCKKIQVNLEDTAFTKCYDEQYRGKCTEQVPLVINKLM